LDYNLLGTPQIRQSFYRYEAVIVFDPASAARNPNEQCTTPAAARAMPQAEAMKNSIVFISALSLSGDDAAFVQYRSKCFCT